MKNSINWFEIPATDFDRAKEFYGKLFGVEIQVMPHPEMTFGEISPNSRYQRVNSAQAADSGASPLCHP